MSIFDFLFKKKEEPVVNTIKNMEHSEIAHIDEDGTVHNEEYVLAKNICTHLKVAGTKYYLMRPVDSKDDSKLYLRCRYKNAGNKSFREPIEDLLETNPAVVATGTNKKLVTIDLENMLKGNIDYILVDRDEKTGEVFYYFSFKGLIEKNKPSGTIEGYLVLNSKDGDLVNYLYNIL